ncbi:hypothetical protein IMSAG192_01228 [Muribaculaceae bacterium]|nr:hypothetical protein IMSAG192_01228 [Muribaculaceae bacterium]
MRPVFGEEVVEFVEVERVAAIINEGLDAIFLGLAFSIVMVVVMAMVAVCIAFGVVVMVVVLFGVLFVVSLMVAVVVMVVGLCVEFLLFRHRALKLAYPSCRGGHFLEVEQMSIE